MPGYSWNFPAAKLVHVDVDHAELGRNYAPDLRQSSRMRSPFCRTAAGGGRKADAEPARRVACGDRAVEGGMGKYIRPNFEMHASPIRPERIVADCRAVLPDEAIISLDSGIHHNWSCSSGRRAGRRPC